MKQLFSWRTCFIWLPMLIVGLVFHPLYAQNMSKKYEKESLSIRLRQLSKDFNTNIGYRSEDCQFMVGELTLVNSNIEEALQKSLAGTNLVYKKINDSYTIVPKAQPQPARQSSGVGAIKGRIVESGTYEPLVGVTVQIKALKKGVISDFDGYYRLENIPAGTHTLEVSYMGYETKTLKVDISPRSTLSHDFVLAVDDNVLEEVIVTGIRKQRRSVPHASQSQLTSEIKSMQVVASGISSEQISKSADRNAAQAVQRVSGVSVVDDRFVVLRGLNPRYNLTYLNNNIAPATEVYSRSFALDLIPSRVIDKIIVMKSSSPENQADATGGVIKVFTKEAQAVRHLDVDVQVAMKTGSTFQKMLSHQGGKWDWLGFDDGTRGLPSVVPGFGSTDIAKISQAKYVEGFTPILWHSQRSALPNAQITVNYYDAFKIGGFYLYSLTSANYKHEESVTNRFRQQGIGEYTSDDTADKLSWDLQGSQTSQFNLLQNFTLKLGNQHDIQLKNFLLQSGVSNNTERTSIRHNAWYHFQKNGSANPFSQNLDAILSYRERFLYAGNLSGNHSFGTEGKHQLKWNLGYNFTRQSVPDQRVVRYTSPYNIAIGDRDLQYTAVIRQGGDQKRVLFGSISRTWLQNTDDLYNLSADYKVKLAPWASLGVGTFQQYKRREFYRRVYTVNEGDLTGSADDYTTRPGYSGFINPHLIQFNRNDIAEVWSNKYLRDDKTGLKVYDRTQGSDTYKGTEQNNAGYLSGTLTPWEGLVELHGGVRIEYNKQAIGAAFPANSTLEFSGTGHHINRPIYTEYAKLDWFPSVSISIKPLPNLILRGGYSQTINRPEFRETSPFEEIDYEGDQVVRGNPMLRPSFSKNIDARIEYYFGGEEQRGESISIGVFHKQLTNPIERMNYSHRTGGLTYITFSNAEKATIRGIEVELNKKLDFIPIVPFKQLSAGVNLSYINSRVTQDSVRLFNSHIVKIDRRLQGQAPFILNAVLYYDNPGIGTKAGLTYNLVGERIYAATPGYDEPAAVFGFKGGAYRGSIIELPRHQLDFSITQRIGKGWQAKLAVQNILNKPIEMAEDFNFTYKYEPYQDLTKEQFVGEDPKEWWREKGDNISSRYHPGRYFSLSLSYSF